MVTWWVLAIVLVGLLVLALAGLSVLTRVGRLARAAARTQRQVGGATALQDSLAQLQEGLERLQVHATSVQEQVAARRRSTP